MSPVRNRDRGSNMYYIHNVSTYYINQIIVTWRADRDLFHTG